MKILYIGDIMGEIGCKVTARLLPEIRQQYQPDIVLAQAENVTHGKGISLADLRSLRALGIDGFTSGNHIFAKPEIISLLDDPAVPVTRPANYPEGTPGLRYKFLPTKFGDILLVTLLGQVVGKDAGLPMDNPLLVIDKIIEETKGEEKAAIIVNFHGDYSSEKVVIGQYLDGRVAAVIGDHWHVPSADGRILPGGTAHISDVGMAGTLNSSLGVKTDIIIKRWRGEDPGRNELATAGPYQFCAVLIDYDPAAKRAQDITQIIQYLDILD